MSKSKLALIMALLTPSLTFASQSTFESINTFADDGAALVGSRETGQIISITISHSRAGNQSLFFDYFKIDEDGKITSTCEKKREVEDSIMRINNQPVRFNLFCYEDASGIWYESKAAQTDVGKEFVINAFRKSNTVTVSSPQYSFEVPAKGFTQAWENAGGDAL